MDKSKIAPLLPNFVRTALPVGFRVELIGADSVDFSSLELVLQSNYYDGFVQQTLKPQRALARDYLSSQYGAQYSGAMCVEMPLPKHLTSKLELHISDGLNAEAAVCLFHAGRNGCIAPLHFDWDRRFVLHVCLSGRKALYFIPPDAGWLLNPVINTSAICFPRLSQRDRRDLLRRLGGTEVELVSGKAVLFPSSWWHAVWYERPSMAVSVRFGEDPTLRPFGALPRSFWLQRLIWQLSQRKVRLAASECLKRSLEVFFQPQRSWIRRYYETNSVYRTILLEAGQSFGAEYLVSESFNSEIYMAKQELKSLYSINTHELRTGSPREIIETIRLYLFGQSPDFIPYEMQVALAKYAFAKRQGLPPHRGLIAVRRMSEKAA